jgi:hypothetical protein
VPSLATVGHSSAVHHDSGGVQHHTGWRYAGGEYVLRLVGARHAPAVPYDEPVLAVPGYFREALVEAALAHDYGCCVEQIALGVHARRVNVLEALAALIAAGGNEVYRRADEVGARVLPHDQRHARPGCYLRVFLVARRRADCRIAR